MRPAILSALLVVAFLASPVAQAAPCAGFADVDDTTPFCASVAWMKNRGITLGCAAGMYCPSDAVTRLQLALFLKRTADSLFPLDCATGQVIKWNGSAWLCANDANAGTVTGVGAGTGLAANPSPISTVGTLSVAPSYQLPQSCANGQIAKSNGAGAWSCASDNTVANAFVQGGNAFGATAVLGTNDNEPLDVRVGGQRAMRYEPRSVPNLIGGFVANATVSDTHGAVIAGGGGPGGNCFETTTGLSNRPCANRATDRFAVVGGGHSNRAGDDQGDFNSAPFSTVAGGDTNTASATGSSVGGGAYNIAEGNYSAVIGGFANTAAGNSAAIVAGSQNVATGDFSFAAGVYARADQPLCAVFSLWDPSPPGIGCLGATHVVRIGAKHGFSVDYYAKRPGDGGGERWLTIGDLFPGKTINTWKGAHLTDAGVWVDASSSGASKTDFEAVDSEDVLQKVAGMPILTWRYREGEEGVRHIGPMAEDFYAAFGVGYGAHTISNLDARGVAFAAIQGLNARLNAARLEERQARESLARELASVRNESARRIAALERAVEALIVRQRNDAKLSE